MLTGLRRGQSSIAWQVFPKADSTATYPPRVSVSDAMAAPDTVPCAALQALRSPEACAFGCADHARHGTANAHTISKHMTDALAERHRSSTMRRMRITLRLPCSDCLFPAIPHLLS